MFYSNIQEISSFTTFFWRFIFVIEFFLKTLFAIPWTDAEDTWVYLKMSPTTTVMGITEWNFVVRMAIQHFMG